MNILCVLHLSCVRLLFAFITGFIYAPPADIDGIREPVSGSLLYGNILCVLHLSCVRLLFAFGFVFWVAYSRSQTLLATYKQA